MAQSVKGAFGSDYNLGGPGLSPTSGSLLSRQSALPSPSVPPPTPALSLSLAHFLSNKLIKSFLKNLPMCICFKPSSTQLPASGGLALSFSYSPLYPHIPVLHLASHAARINIGRMSDLMNLGLVLRKSHEFKIFAFVLQIFCLCLFL